jgi:hypothetical protein
MGHSFTRGRRTVLVLAALAGLALTAGLAYASIPDDTGPFTPAS